jgi:hypothetical protein
MIQDLYYECYSLFHEIIPIIMVYLLYMYGLYGKLLGNGEVAHGSTPTDLRCVPPGCEYVETSRRWLLDYNSENLTRGQ